MINQNEQKFEVYNDNESDMLSSWHFVDYVLQIVLFFAIFTSASFLVVHYVPKMTPMSLILIILGRNVPKTAGLQMVVYFPHSPN